MDANSGPVAGRNSVAKCLKQRLIHGIALGIVFGMPLNSKSETGCVGDPDGFDSSILRHPLDDYAITRFENALTMQRVDPDDLPPKDLCEYSFWKEPHLVPVPKDYLRIRMDFTRFEPGHSVVHAARKLADFMMECSAKGNIHLLETTANTKNWYRARHTDLDQLQSQGVPILVIGFMPPMGFGIEAGWVDVCASARQNHTIDGFEQGSDIGDAWGTSKHQWQSTCDFRHSKKRSCTNGLNGEAVFDETCIAYNANNRPAHISSFRPVEHSN